MEQQATVIKSAKHLLDKLVVEVEATMKETGKIPENEVVGWSFTGQRVWKVKLREYEASRTERAVALLEAIQLFCFSPSATYISFSFTYLDEADSSVTACLLVADSDKISGYFGTVVKDDEGNFESLARTEVDGVQSVREFDGEMFGAFSGVMQYSAEPIEDIQPLINVLNRRGHEVTLY